MGLNLKDEETVALVTEVARRTGRTKTATVRELAREKLAELDMKAADLAQARAADNLRWLQEEVWPHTAGKSLTKDEINELLGFDEMGDE
jgi:hypothetical protein